MANEYYKGGHLLLLNIAIALGTFIQVLDSSIANVAIPYIAGSLSVSADEGTWVITSFAASNAVVLPLTGWLSDYFGRVRLFVGSVLLFSLTSLLCGFSTSLTMLVVVRTLQGAVAGSLIPLSQSLMNAHNPPEKQGGALGFWAMIVVVAPVLGPIVGGYLTEAYSWPWIFYINVPIGLFSAAITWYYLKDQESKLKRAPIDWLGLFLLSLGVACMQIMLDKGKDLDWFTSNTIVLLTVISVVSFGYFFVWNFFQKHKIVDFGFFKNRNFAFGTLAITLGYLIYFSSTVTIPLWLQTQQGYTAYWAGIAVAPVGIPPLFLSIIVGKLLNRFDLRIMAASSFVIFAFGFWYQSQFTTQIDVFHIMLARFLQGFGISLFFLPITQISFGEISKEKYASATGLFHFTRILIGSGFGTSLSIELWSRLEIFHHARLTEALTNYRASTIQFYHKLKNFNAGLTDHVVNIILDKQVEQQAYMMSTNDMLWLGSWLFLCLIPVIFLCKYAKPSKEASVVEG